jgi:hypothetical protein
MGQPGASEYQLRVVDPRRVKKTRALAEAAEKSVKNL